MYDVQQVPEEIANKFLTCHLNWQLEDYLGVILLSL